MSKRKNSTESRTIPCKRCRLLSKDEFIARLKTYFSPIKANSPRPPQDWACIQQSLDYFAVYFKCSELLAVYFDFIFAALDFFHVTDRAVIASSIEKYGRFQMNYWGLPPPDFDEFPYPRERRIMRQYDRSVAPRCLGELVFRPFLYHDLRALRRTIGYVSPTTYSEDEDLEHYIKEVISSIGKDPCLTMTFYKYAGRYSFHKDIGRRRLNLLTMLLDFVQKVRNEKNPQPIAGLRLLFETIPDPYLTWQDISWFVNHMLCLQPKYKLKEYIKNCKKTCMEYYPEGFQVPKPRSLKHLARCSVRRCLGRNHTLPHGARDLGLPKVLQEYVTLEY